MNEERQSLCPKPRSQKFNFDPQDLGQQTEEWFCDYKVEREREREKESFFSSLRFFKFLKPCIQVNWKTISEPFSFLFILDSLPLYWVWKHIFKYRDSIFSSNFSSFFFLSLTPIISLIVLLLDYKFSSKGSTFLLWVGFELASRLLALFWIGNGT